MNALRNSEFDPKQLKMEVIEDGFVNSSCYGKEQELKALGSPRADEDDATAEIVV